MKSIIKDFIPNLVAVRKQLHQFPEVGLDEIKTTETIIKFLSENSNGTIHTFNPTGLLVEFDSGVAGKNIMIRGDIDALPIQEINDFPHQSTIKGVSHKCGHDGHTTILLGLAKLLTLEPMTKGKVSLLFQPAEENGKGAELVLADDYFESLHFDFVYALHNLPRFPLHEIVLKKGNFNANVKTLIINYKGKTAHAAEPEKGHNPSLAIAETLQFCHQITHNVPEDADFFLITPAYTNIGQKAYGISPGFGTLHLTIRSWDLELFDQKIGDLQKQVESICKKYSLAVDYEWTEVFFANVNNEEAIKNIKKAAEICNFSTVSIETPFKWGEDFGLFTQKFKGAMFGIGAGENTPALHNPDYDFPDEILTTAIQTFYQTIKNTQNA